MLQSGRTSLPFYARHWESFRLRCRRVNSPFEFFILKCKWQLAVGRRSPSGRPLPTARSYGSSHCGFTCWLYTLLKKPSGNSEGSCKHPFLDWRVSCQLLLWSIKWGHWSSLSKWVGIEMLYCNYNSQSSDASFDNNSCCNLSNCTLDLLFWWLKHQLHPSNQKQL